MRLRPLFLTLALVPAFALTSMPTPTQAIFFPCGITADVVAQAPFPVLNFFPTAGTGTLFLNMGSVLIIRQVRQYLLVFTDDGTSYRLKNGTTATNGEFLTGDLVRLDAVDESGCASVLRNLSVTDTLATYSGRVSSLTLPSVTFTHGRNTPVTLNLASDVVITGSDGLPAPSSILAPGHTVRVTVRSYSPTRLRTREISAIQDLSAVAPVIPTFIPSLPSFPSFPPPPTFID